MGEWKLAMLALLPLMAARRRVSWLQFLTSPMVRTWCALFGASVATYFATTPESYFIIDGLAAAVVLRPKAGCAQRAIGALFASMMVFDLGFILGGENAPTLYLMGLTGMGWAQWAFMALWIGHDFFGHSLARWRAARNPAPARTGD